MFKIDSKAHFKPRLAIGYTGMLRELIWMKMLLDINIFISDRSLGRVYPGRKQSWNDVWMDQSAWRKHGDNTLEVKIRIPPNTTASVLLPNAKKAMLREHGAALKQTVKPRETYL
ncbi:alpha-L-rhamnosidase C-terminal domain-containing protein [Paenibacillus sedimenti]|uniref:alpha-L-rhamnosidase C-terminal domain-containing protein n=1 Tax=Paenibacillus sedimenti TaxID=2770274 RepID=UPI00406B9082